MDERSFRDKFKRTFNIVFTSHAIESLLKRSIKEETVLNALDSPDKILLDVETKYLIFIKKLDSQSIIVVCDIEEETYKVVTAYKSSRVEKILSRKIKKKRWVEL